VIDAGAAADLLTRAAPETLAAAYGVVSALAAGLASRAALRACGLSPGLSPLGWGAVAGVLTFALTLAMLAGHCQETPEVRPSLLWWTLRPAYHSLLCVLLITATATDLRSYFILDAVTFAGAAAGVLLAVLAGDLQMCHVWVDWNQEVPQLSGPYIPAWLGERPHWHGLAWSLAGLVVGAGLTWGARAISSWLLEQEALGFGDVTLMGMIGAFVGWQPVVMVFLLAPLCAVAIGLAVRVVSRRTYVPYGPFLALAAVVVLFNWRAIWMLEIELGAPGAQGGATFALRRLFGDAVGLLILAGMIGGGLVLLLGALRLYRRLPAR
jgi:leader peptidase (prepilin peptidase)/N-methyltransferase